MNINRAEYLANELMKKHGLPEMGYKFKFNRKKHSAGVCSYLRKTIELSLPLTELADEADVVDTILHEIAHALTPTHGHDHVWRKKAIEIGCNGRRCFDTKKSTIEAYNKIAKYKGVCPNGHETFKNRLPKRNQSCGICCKVYNPKYIIVYNYNI